MRTFFLGSYITGAMFTFLIVGFACALGGRNEELWKPFVYAVFWPVMLPLFLSGRV
jgi:hypothetical protein